jgi:hypothetical protein
LQTIENSILCEKLKALSESFSSVLISSTLESKLTAELDQLKNSLSSLCTADSEIRSQSQNFSLNQRQLEESISSVLSFNSSFKDRAEKIIRVLKDQIKVYQDESKILLSTNVELLKETQDLDFQRLTIANELAGVRKSLAQHSKRFRDLICQNCKKLFREEDNFNWSCKTHLSVYNGTMFWCCGQTDKDAEGCIVGKHVWAEDEEHKGNIKNTVFCSVKYMQSCKEVGHASKDCPKDPNARTLCDPVQELERISENLKQKAKIHVDVLNQQLWLQHQRTGTIRDKFALFSDFEDVQEVKIEAQIKKKENLYEIEQLEIREKKENRRKSVGSVYEFEGDN